MYDRVTHVWMFRALRAIGMPEKILQLIEIVVTKWETVFEVGGLDCEIHTGRVKYNRGIQGRSTFPLHFTLTILWSLRAGR